MLWPIIFSILVNWPTGGRLCLSNSIAGCSCFILRLLLRRLYYYIRLDVVTRSQTLNILLFCLIISKIEFILSLGVHLMPVPIRLKFTEFISEQMLSFLKTHCYSEIYSLNIFGCFNQRKINQ